MPNPVTGALMVSQTGAAPGSARADTNGESSESGFLDILNMIAAGPQPDQKTPSEEPLETAVDVPDETVEIETVASETTEGQDIPIAPFTAPPIPAESVGTENEPPSANPSVHMVGPVEAEDRSAPSTRQDFVPDQRATVREPSADLQQSPKAHAADTVQHAVVLRTAERGLQEKAPADQVAEIRSAASESGSVSPERTDTPNTRQQSVLANAVASQLNMAVAKPAADQTDPPPEAPFELMGEAREGGLPSTGRDIPQTSGAIAPRPEIARSIAGQLAATITAKPGAGEFEIALNPEELGRVSISLGGREDGLHLMITAERAETLELMRRHISVLAAEFQKLGYGDLSFDLGMSGENPRDFEKSHASESVAADSPENPEETAPPAYQTGHDGGLDLRL